MKFPQTSDDLKSEILISSDKAQELGDLRLRQLIKILDKADHDLIVEGVINVFEIANRSGTLFQDQEFAGRILEAVNPKTKKNLQDLLSRTLLSWDKSVEQLPFWFRNNYGIENVQTAFNEIEVSEKAKDKLEAMKFWLQLK